MNKMLKRMINGSMLFIVIAMVFIFITNTKTVNAETIEMEPNNNFQNAQEVVLGEQYNGVVEDVGGVDDEDYFKIVLKEGQFCKITVFNLEDLNEVKWETMLAEFCTDSNTGNAYGLHASYRESVTKLFRASYTGNYYMHFYNTGKSKYSFIVEDYNPVGKMVKDSDSNLYKITSDNTLEFAKIASKKATSHYFIGTKSFSDIDGIDMLNSYDASFTVTSIGKNAFKGSNLKSISLSEDIKKIGSGAFQNCKKLGTEKYVMGVVIHGKNVVIEKDAFKGCKNLGTVRVLKSASVKSIKKNAFKGTKKGIRIEVPNVKKYKKIFKNAGVKSPKYSKSYM